MWFYIKGFHNIHNYARYSSSLCSSGQPCTTAGIEESVCGDTDMVIRWHGWIITRFAHWTPSRCTDTCCRVRSGPNWPKDSPVGPLPFSRSLLCYPVAAALVPLSSGWFHEPAAERDPAGSLLNKASRNPVDELVDQPATPIPPIIHSRVSWLVPRV